jgi:predicted aspartyl protease
MRRALLCCLLAACAHSGIGPRQTLLPEGGLVLPADLERGVWLVPVHLGDEIQPRRFLLDTGTDRTLLDVRLAEQLGIGRRADGALQTATGHRLAIELLQPLRLLRLGSAEFHDVDVASVDLSGLRAESGLPLEGIIGCDLFRDCLLELDYVLATARLLPRATAPAGGHEFAERVPWVDALLAGTQLRLLIDTGFQQSLSVPETTVLPWSSPPRAAGALATLDGTMPIAAARVRGTLAIGELRWSDPRVILAAGSPKLGAGLLRRHRLLLDARGGRVWLEQRGPRVATAFRRPPASAR